MLENQPNGRFLAYDPRTKQTRVLLNDLYFANGVAVSPDQSFVLVNDTSSYRVLRYWLTGPKQGQSDVFIDNLQVSDGISSNGKDTFWLALVNRRDPGLDFLMPHPFCGDSLAIAFIPATEYQALRVRARARHQRQSHSQSSGPFSPIIHTDRQRRRAQGPTLFWHHRESPIGRMPLPPLPAKKALAVLTPRNPDQQIPVPNPGPPTIKTPSRMSLSASVCGFHFGRKDQENILHSRRTEAAILSDLTVAVQLMPINKHPREQQNEYRRII